MDSRDFSSRYPVGDALMRGIRVPRSAFPVADALLAKPQEITIYVRKGDHPKERTISINPIPEGVDPLALLNAGFAIDGNSATISVDAFTYSTIACQQEGDVTRIERWQPGRVPEWGASWTLTKAVHSVERTLANWLKKQGCAVKFG